MIAQGPDCSIQYYIALLENGLTKSPREAPPYNYVVYSALLQAPEKAKQSRRGRELD